MPGHQIFELGDVALKSGLTLRWGPKVAAHVGDCIPFSQQLHDFECLTVSWGCLKGRGMPREQLGHSCLPLGALPQIITSSH